MHLSLRSKLEPVERVLGMKLDILARSDAYSTANRAVGFGGSVFGWEWRNTDPCLLPFFQPRFCDLVFNGHSG